MKPPTYVYDGACVLCSGAVQYVIKHDKSDPPIRFVAITSQEGRRIAADAGVEPDDPRTFIYVEDGKHRVSSDAAFALAKRAGGPARLLCIFRFVPKPIRDWAYARIANNRYALFGKRDQCYLPTAETQHRFVLE
ncbi:MAG: DCC1-like thiol-disulfide oxidoreductase family protein [Pseudomonadota bacterium]